MRGKGGEGLRENMNHHCAVLEGRNLQEQGTTRGLSGGGRFAFTCIAKISMFNINNDPR